MTHSALCLRRSVGGQRCSPPPSSRLGKNRGGGVYKKLTPSRPCRLASKRELQQHLMSPSSCAVSASAQQILYIAWPFPPASLSQPCPHVCHAANTPNARAHTHLFTPHLDPMLGLWLPRTQLTCICHPHAVVLLLWHTDENGLWMVAQSKSKITPSKCNLTNEKQ